MEDWNLRREYITLIFGILMFVLALGGTFTGKFPRRRGGVCDRTKDPKEYWSALAISYLAGIGFIACYLYDIRAFSK
jgi:hypothetical protein